MAYSPKRLRPAHLEMVTFHLAGESNQDIAIRLGYTAQQVSNILNSPEVLEIIEALKAETLNTISQVQVEAQLYAPEILRRKIDYALHGTDDRVRNNAQTEILNIAGHVPVRHITVESRSAIQEKYKDKTDDDLRAFVTGATSDKGPDGKLLQ